MGTVVLKDDSLVRIDFMTRKYFKMCIEIQDKFVLLMD